MLLAIIFVLCMVMAIINKIVKGGSTFQSILTGIIGTLLLTFFIFYPRKDGVFWAVFVIAGFVAFALYSWAAFGIMMLVLLLRWLYGMWYGHD